jgi:hypothetical protein
MADELKPLRDIAKAQVECLLKTMECYEHILALEAVLIALDNRAKALLEKQVAVEHSKNQKRREELEMMLRATPIPGSAKPS